MAQERDGLKGVAECQCRRENVALAKMRAIPARFRASSLDNYEPADQMQTEAKLAVKSEPFGNFFLFGGYGRGKTHLAVAQYKIMIGADKPCMFFTMADLLAELRMAEMRLTEDSICLIRERVKYAENFHLFIDDIDKFKVTDFKFEVLFDLINTAYSRGCGLTITSNLDLAGLTHLLDPSIVRRIDDSCKAVEV